MMGFLRNIDIWINVHVFGGKDETISSRLGRHIKRDGCFVCKVFCRLVLIPLSVVLKLFGYQKSWRHCVESIKEVER
jgi:hypothetical protein